MAYQEFAYFYDEFNGAADYDALFAYVTGELKAHGIQDGIVADFGCGTGELTLMLAQAGYDMIGIDASPEMLQEAAGKRERSGHDILYLMQDMREFELYGTVRAVVSVCDSLNYITEEEDLLKVFRLVNNYLDPGGIFIFDMNTVYKYRELLADHVFAENRDESSFIWENWFDEETQINEYGLTLFLRTEEGLYEKYEETHYQKAYSIDTVRSLLERAGMKVEAVYDAFTQSEPGEKSERVCFVAREQGKKEKLC